MSHPPGTRTYASAYVAFLDILGFKATVLNHTHEHLESLYLRTLCETLEHALSDGKYVLITEGERKSIGPDIRKAKVNSLLISDSVLLWTEDSEAESFVNIVNAVRNLLAFSVVGGLLLRGAIAVGPLTVVFNQWPSQTHSFQHSLFGRAIVDAVEAEKAQQWAGCVVTPKAMDCYQASCEGTESLVAKKLVISYPIPGKGDKVEVGHAIDWVNHPEAGIDFESVKGAFAPSPSTSRAEFEQIKKKLTNTLNFVKFVKPSAEQPRGLRQFV